jgi:flagellar biosynthetic protein FlhB
MASAEQTEKPTRKRIEEARKKGQIPRSRDLALAAASVAATFALARMGGTLVTSLATRLAEDLSRLGNDPLHTLTGPEVTGLAVAGLQVVATLVGPIALATMVAGVGTHGFQGGWTFSPEALHLNWSRLNPANGLKRFGLVQSGADTLKAIIAVTGISYLAWLAISAAAADSMRMSAVAPNGAASIGWEHAETLLWRVGWFLGLMAIGDYALQRYRVMSSLKMTRQEVKDEAKLQEGNAEVKGRIRRVQREMARRRMMGDVAKATVVITNPTHFAVALEYRRESMAAPRVLAKGQDLLALKIRELATKHGVPIVENKPLARSLYDTAEVGDTIPAQLYSAVAEVLAYLVRIKQLML